MIAEATAKLQAGVKLVNEAGGGEIIQEPKPKPSKSSSIAENMMKKMGWKGKGHGIGRNEQGMALPLIAERSGTGSQGVIINTSEHGWPRGG